MNKLHCIFLTLLLGVVALFSSAEENDFTLMGKWTNNKEGADKIVYNFSKNNLLKIDFGESSETVYYQIKDSNIIINRYILENFKKIDSLGFLNNDNNSLILFQGANVFKHQSINDSTEIAGFEAIGLTVVSSDTIKISTATGELVLFRPDSTSTVNKTLKPQAGFSFMSLMRGLLGMIVLIFIAWIFSTNRKKISW
ncbi:MAG: hypothetical protein M0P32_09565, partial [Bacteroidales bacterium]|nr:hypothetical protein [Bacteroidales bacterium]